jgi:hypothetical protein
MMRSSSSTAMLAASGLRDCIFTEVAPERHERNCARDFGDQPLSRLTKQLRVVMLNGHSMAVPSKWCHDLQRVTQHRFVQASGVRSGPSKAPFGMLHLEIAVDRADRLRE